MQVGKITKLNMCGLNPFDFQIKYNEIEPATHIYEIDIHTHDKFEIYINVDGDISFFVKDSLCPVSPGDVIVARPGEEHHCIYHSDRTHKFFWILFDCQENEDVLDFLKNDFGGNCFTPRITEKEELLSLCQTLHGENLSKEDQLYSFLRIFAILKQSKSNHIKQQQVPDDLDKINKYIDQHIHEPLTVTQIARDLYLSQSTLERKFKQTLNMTPLEYIRRKKLLLASQMLKNGESVLQTGIRLGYNDNSYFIELFKRYFKCTPYEYKKQNT